MALILGRFVTSVDGDQGAEIGPEGNLVRLVVASG
jgi:hypothetical protein